MLLSTPNRYLRTVLSLVSAIALAATAGADILTYGVCLDGAQAGTASGGTGFVTVVINTTTGEITVSGTYSGLSGSQTIAHTHGPAAIGATAGFVLTLAGTGGTSGTITAAGMYFPTEVAELVSGLHYVNLHSTLFPAGEIRGQIVQQKTVVCPAELATDPTLTDIAGNLSIGPKVGSATEPFDLALDCTGAPSGGLYAFLITETKHAVPTATGFGDIWVTGPPLLKVFGTHTKSVEEFGTVVLPADPSAIGFRFHIQGFCGNSTPGTKGRVSNALTHWIGL